MAKEKRSLSGDVPRMTTTLWDYRSQNYPGSRQGDPDYAGATPSYIVWNLLQLYTKPKALVVDPMAGSGTTLDVARDCGRRALGYDIEPTRKDIFRADARSLPLETAKADFVFCDPPYSSHIRYSGRPECIGELNARQGPEYFEAMETVIAEMDRVLRPDRFMALYVCDSAKKGKTFVPIGFELFSILRRHFTPVDVIAVVRHNRTLKRQRWHDRAGEGNFFLRGFNYLFIMHKEREIIPRPAGKKPGRQVGSPHRDPAGEGRMGKKPARSNARGGARRAKKSSGRHKP